MTDSAAQTTSLIDEMSHCLTLDRPKSFFLFAGAGSGKTQALVEAVKTLRKNYGQELRHSARKVAVITYTNAACDEILSRIEYDSLFAVSTIHSFAWELIHPYSTDIREWLRQDLQGRITDLQEQQRTGRGGRISAERAAQIQSHQMRIERLDTLKYFTYNPNGENTGKNSLTHSEVIAIAAVFLTHRPLMQTVLVRKYPVLLIDESQDTQKDLLDAFLTVQSKRPELCLALFGDTMQRIYADGKIGLDTAIPDTWAKPAITINYRCPKRVVRLINTVRACVRSSFSLV